MSFIKDALAELSLPPLPKENAREALLDAIARHEFGRMPPVRGETRALVKFKNEQAYANKAVETGVELTVSTPGGDFTFPVYYICPKADAPVPFFVHIAFRDTVPDRYVPTEELIDRGYALLLFCYNDVTEDKDDGYTSGIAPLFGERTHDAPSKIAMWAFAASRVLDFALTRPELDRENAAVMGHSRLGKTALYAGASDERFKFTFSNDSGCSGAALARESARHEDAEKVERIAAVFPYWFSGDYASYGGRENDMPFDQHWLLAACAPRYVYVASAEEDKWACPTAEFLACAAASEEWESFGLAGFIADDAPPAAGCAYHDGHIGYHMRSGSHFLSRTDWNMYMDFIDGKNKR